jgi:hypothetical protein
MRRIAASPVMKPRFLCYEERLVFRQPAMTSHCDRILTDQQQFGKKVLASHCQPCDLGRVKVPHDAIAPYWHAHPLPSAI